MGPSGTSRRLRPGDGSPGWAAQSDPPAAKAGAAPLVAPLVYVQIVPVSCQVAGSMRCIVVKRSELIRSGLLGSAALTVGVGLLGPAALTVRVQNVPSKIAA